SRRYETASALALDLQRYLADEPVLAGPPSVRYRLRKFVHRHRGPVLAASLLLLALLAGVGGTAWGLVRALDAEADARDQLQRTRAAEQMALERLTRAESAE